MLRLRSGLGPTESVARKGFAMLGCNLEYRPSAVRVVVDEIPPLTGDKDDLQRV